MLGDFLSRAVNASTAPARKAISTSSQILETLRSVPVELENFAAEFRQAQREAEQQLQQIANEVDASFDRDVADMTADEREAATYVELAKAEQLLSQALFSVLKAVRLTIAEPGRVIEHEDVVKGRLNRRR